MRELLSSHSPSMERYTALRGERRGDGWRKKGGGEGREGEKEGEKGRSEEEKMDGKEGNYIEHLSFKPAKT